MIDAIRRNAPVTVQLEENGPISIMNELSLSKRTIVDDNDNELTVAVEYRVPGNDRIVHRSADVKLKRGLDVATQVGSFG